MRTYGIPFLALPLLLAGCQGDEAKELPALSRSANELLVAGDYHRASRIMVKMASRHTADDPGLVTSLFSGVAADGLSLSFDAKIFVARLFLENENLPCACEAYRSAIGDMFSTPLRELMGDGYTRNMLILRRYLRRCHASPAVLLMRSLLAIARDVSYKSPLGQVESDNPQFYAIRGISTWLDNRFELAHADFQRAADLGEGYGFLEADGVFMAQYSAYMNYENSQARLEELEARIETLTWELQRSLGDKSAAWDNALSLDVVDVALLTLEKAGEKPINRAAGAVGLALTLKDAIDLYRSIERVTQIRGNLDNVKTSAGREAKKVERFEEQREVELARRKLGIEDLERIQGDLGWESASLSLKGCLE